MTEDQPDLSAGAQGDADQERWLTYLNYDQPVKQAVRRLGALSSENVDLFRALLMKGRDRSRVNEYEAESIRRLQGEAFVGDEELQGALIVLNAEDPHLAEEFKRMVTATGKPQELDQAIAALRSKDAPAPPPKIRLVETPPAEVPPPKAPEPPPPAEAPRAKAPEPPPPAEVPRAKTPEPPPPQPQKEIPAASLRREEAPPIKVRAAISRPAPEPVETGTRKGLLPIAAAVLVLAVAGLAILWPRLVSDDSAKPDRIVMAPQTSERQAAEPQAVEPQAPQSQAAGPQSAPAAAPSQTAQRPAQIATQAPSNTNKAEGKKAPEMRPASDGPDRILPEKTAPQAAPGNTPATPVPVPGAYYKVVAGDMLSEIAVRAYRDASKFHLIQRANPSLRASADRILVDQVIFIPRVP